MTKITFFKRDNVYYGFRETGHAGYGEGGDDIVCSALSAMTMLIINTLEVAYDVRVDYTIDEKSTDITVKCLSALPEHEDDERKRFAVSGLFAGYYAQLADMTEEYYDYIEVGETEE